MIHRWDYVDKPYLRPMRYLKYILLLFALLAAYLVIAPSPIDPVAISFPKNELIEALLHEDFG